MSAPFESVCPSCGATLVPGGDVHVCSKKELHRPLTTPGTVSSSSEAARIVPCSHCGGLLDVSSFDPLEMVDCYFCHRKFELLRHFAEGELMQPYEVGWHEALYLARDLEAPGTYLIKFLSSHLLAQPDAELDFFRKVEQITASCPEELVLSTRVGKLHGFDYVWIQLKEGVPPGELLHHLGIELSVEKAFPTAAPAGKILRYTQCPSCHKEVDATDCDPLDSVYCPHCNHNFEVMRQLGEYRLDYRLNFGGTSILYLAADLKNFRQVALKVLSAAEMKRAPESAAALLKEVELTKKLQHPNVIQVYDGGSVDGFYYMAMELVDGLTLNQVLEVLQPPLPKEDKPTFEQLTEKERFRQGLPELVCLEIALQTAAGLGIAHQHGLIHGDVKPENIMITFEGVVKVLDFGLVQFANADKLHEDDEAAVFGTPFYIPPERVLGEAEDFRSDIYSLGATLYHLLRGIAPFRARSPEEIAIMHAVSPLVSFKAFLPWLSDTTCRIVQKSLSKSVQDRYGSHLEFISDITLAKNQIFQLTGERHRDGRSILKKFISELPADRFRVGIWKKAATVAIHTYKYATMAITNRVRKLMKTRASPTA
jgi:serine/threonine protein kinase